MNKLRTWFRRNPVVGGGPILGLCFGGLYALTTFQQGRFELVDRRIKSQTEKEYDLEQEYEQIMRKMDLSDYEIVPLERPDESKRTTQDDEEDEED